MSTAIYLIWITAILSAVIRQCESTALVRRRFLKISSSHSASTNPWSFLSIYVGTKREIIPRSYSIQMFLCREKGRKTREKRWDMFCFVHDEVVVVQSVTDKSRDIHVCRRTINVLWHSWEQVFLVVSSLTLWLDFDRGGKSGMWASQDFCSQFLAIGIGLWTNKSFPDRHKPGWVHSIPVIHILCVCVPVEKREPCTPQFGWTVTFCIRIMISSFDSRRPSNGCSSAPRQPSRSLGPWISLPRVCNSKWLYHTKSKNLGNLCPLVFSPPPFPSLSLPFSTVFLPQSWVVLYRKERPRNDR